ncbi:MAG TPA: SelB C-terminal domain-containing protein, partial [Vicinamibacterales bacterium]|nr:SelB C-terminal domain-containing protein [Vicinamibacterales bacterium]
LPDARPLRHGARVRFHHGTTELLGRVALAATAAAAEYTDHSAADYADHADRSATDHADHADRSATEPAELKPGRRGFARIRLEGPAVLTRGDRFILRQYSPAITIGGGRVLDPAPARSPIRTATAAARFGKLSGDAADAVLTFVEERRVAGLAIDAVARRAGMTAAAAAEIVRALSSKEMVVVASGEVFSASVASVLEARLLAAVAAHHRASPLADGLPREEARERIFGLASPALFDFVLDRMTTGGRIAGRDRLTLPGQGVSLTPEEARAHDALDDLFRDAGLAPPDVAAAAGKAGLATALADRVVKLLIRQKKIVKVDTLLFHADALERLKQDVVGLKQQGGAAKVDVAAFKERYGVSRKYAIPLLEWLDRERVTRRVGDARVVL